MGPWCTLGTLGFSPVSRVLIERLIEALLVLRRLNANSQALYPDLPPLGADGEQIAAELPNSDRGPVRPVEHGLGEFDHSPRCASSKLASDRLWPELISMRRSRFGCCFRLFVRGLPVDVGRTICFLVSSDAHHVTGQDLLCDGGHSIAGDLAHIPGEEALPRSVAVVGRPACGRRLVSPPRLAFVFNLTPALFACCAQASREMRSKRLRSGRHVLSKFFSLSK